MEDFNDLLADFDGYLKAATNGMIQGRLTPQGEVAYKKCEPTLTKLN